jgi:hypothetical protein
MSMNDWKEVKTPGEDERFLKGAEYLRSMQKKPDRALHSKGQLGLSAQLEVLGDLPDWARVGLGAKPATYRAYVRYSNGSGKRQPDRTGDIRGMAVKIIGVEGKKIIPGMENARTQDFLCINHATIVTRTGDEFLALARALRSPATLPFRLIGSLGFGRALAIIKSAPKTVGVKITSFAWTQYFTAAPISWGPAAVKLTLAPALAENPNVERGEGPDYLHDEMVARIQHASVVYDLRIQPFDNEQSTPIEDHSVEWKTPFVTIGRLTVPQQDPLSEDGRKVSDFIEKLSFDPWHALVEHRPLGSIMRARNHAYRLSTIERSAAPEPE